MGLQVALERIQRTSPGDGDSHESGVGVAAGTGESGDDSQAYGQLQEALGRLTDAVSSGGAPREKFSDSRTDVRDGIVIEQQSDGIEQQLDDSSYGAMPAGHSAECRTSSSVEENGSSNSTNF